MKVKVQSIHFTADRKLLQFVEEKVDKLMQFTCAWINRMIKAIRLQKLKYRHPEKQCLPESNVKHLKRLQIMLWKHFVNK